MTTPWWGQPWNGGSQFCGLVSAGSNAYFGAAAHSANELRDLEVGTMRTFFRGLSGIRGRGFGATSALICLLLALNHSAWSADSGKLEANKRLVVAFYDAAINKKDYDLAVTFLGPEYRQHNPTAGDGAAGLKAFVAFLKAKFPTQHGDIKQVIAEGDLVVLHVHSTRGDGTPGRAIVDIFRVANGKVVEHWDVIQDIPEKSANNNGMF